MHLPCQSSSLTSWPVSKIALIYNVGMSVCVFTCLCPPLRILIISGMIWSPYDTLNKFYSCYMAVIVGINSRCGLA